MNCREIETLIHGYADGELDLMTSLEIEQHLQECPSCAQAHEELRAIRAAIKSSDLYFRTPPDLARRIQSSVRKADRSNRNRLAGLRPLLAVAASLALFMAAGWGLARGRSSGSDDSFLDRELVAGHVRSQMLPSHQFDVESSDAHTVKPWFEGKLYFAPPVTELAERGFPLIGGRLDDLHDRPVAALVYRRRKHSINLFIWPSSSGDEAAPAKATLQGFHMIRWMRSRMIFSAVSDLNEGELQEFARLLQQELGRAIRFKSANVAVRGRLPRQERHRLHPRSEGLPQRESTRPGRGQPDFNGDGTG